MNSIWMLAAAESQPEEPAILSSEDAPETQQQEQATVKKEGGSPETETPGKTPSSPLTSFLPIILLFAVMYLFLFRGPKKKQQEHQKMVQALKKNDRVRTIGGILGTVMDVRDDEIVLKIDESTNTKMRVIPAAIAAVLSDKTE